MQHTDMVVMELFLFRERGLRRKILFTSRRNYTKYDDPLHGCFVHKTDSTNLSILRKEGEYTENRNKKACCSRVLDSGRNGYLTQDHGLIWDE
jgi:hypothetical protein